MTEQDDESPKAVREVYTVSDEVLNLIGDGEVAAFRSFHQQSGPDQVFKIGLHTVQNMIVPDLAPIHFEVRHNQDDDPDFMSARYRVLYMTRPLDAHAPYGSYPIPTPPMWGSHRSDVYVIGAKVEGAEKMPGLTRWLSLEHVKLEFD